jgi:hypothetical protein
MLNYQLSQKLKLIGRSKFNNLIITVTFKKSLKYFMHATKCNGRKKKSISSNQ